MAIAEIGGEQPPYSDRFLLTYAKSVNYHLNGIGVVTGVTVDELTVEITPEPTDIIGLLIASATAVWLVKDDMTDRLSKGELGVSFSSGATAITSTQAARSLAGEADKLAEWHNLLLNVYLSGDPSSYNQRLS
jgi:hypothetical protein